jgi:hypothetical protein
VIVEDNYVACQATIVGTFVREFTHSAVGPLPPNRQRVTFELTNIFRNDDDRRLAEEWIQTDNRSVLRSTLASQHQQRRRSQRAIGIVRAFCTERVHDRRAGAVSATIVSMGGYQESASAMSQVPRSIGGDSRGAGGLPTGLASTAC